MMSKGLWTDSNCRVRTHDGGKEGLAMVYQLIAPLPVEHVVSDR